ncbi:MAG TPA: hypothetical protein VIT45_02155 [Allosphingosinicella sp.]
MRRFATRRRLRILAVIVLLLLGAAAFVRIAYFGDRHVPSELIAGVDMAGLDPAARGALIFYGDDFGGLGTAPLETHAVPWRLTAAALVLHARDRDPNLTANAATLRTILSGFGFLFPEEIGNWPAGAPRVRSELPLGMTHARLALLPGLEAEIANLGCSACHGGVTYDPRGLPRPGRAWLGMPNSSLDLEAYTMAVYRAFRATADRPDALIATAARLFPEMGARERFALRRLILPRVARRMAELHALGRPSLFPNGSPGNTNGVAALKQALGVKLIGGGPGDAGITSIPDLGNRTWRTSLLYDGAYAVPGAPRRRAIRAGDVTAAHRASLGAIMTFFTVPSMGVHPDKAIGRLDEAEAVMTFLDGYRPQPFPGPVDRAAAAKGAGLYARDCAACHGSYEGLSPPRLVSFPNWIGQVGTDPLRARAFTPALVNAVAKSPYRDRIAAASTRAYAAPPLTGLWASAPYLHNGSVPTIAALLDPPARPARFMAGGHRLDFEKLGIALAPDGRYPAGYRPWSRPAIGDSKSPGRSNRGHEYGATFSPEERRVLIEYLKLL